jgi:hypothetical protein
MAYSVEKDIENISRKRKKKSAKKRAGNEAFAKKKKKAKEKETWVSSLKRNVQMMLKGKNYKAPKKKKKR